jgi:NAD(P)-dependent dehydrogenase (short-subunit alcohol dehydrogenase family)
MSWRPVPGRFFFGLCRWIVSEGIMQNFKGKVAVITGGASGIGRAIGERLGREGARLILADVERPALEATVAELRAQGLDVIGEVADVTKLESMQELAQRSFDHFGAVHLLFNNAGVVLEEAPNVWDISVNTWTWGLNVNLWGVIHGLKAFMPKLVAQNQEAHVVNTTSHAGALLTPGIIPVYSATKAAMASLTEALYYQLKAQNSPIKVSLLFPGPHTVPTRTYTSSRNRPPELAPEPHEPKPMVASLEEMQAWMLKHHGRKRDTTSAEEVAEQTYQALLEDKYFILPMSERFKSAYRNRVDEIFSGRDPEFLDVM